MTRYVIESENGDGVPLRASSAEAAHRASRRTGMIGGSVNRAEGDAPQAPIKSLYELHVYLRDNSWRTGWKLIKMKGEGGEKSALRDYEIYQKRYGSVWYQIIFDPYIAWSTSIMIAPSRYPRSFWNMSEDEQRAVKETVTTQLDIKGVTMSDIERVAEGLVAGHKKLAEPRKKKDTQYAEWMPRYDADGKQAYGVDRLEGDAAVAAWKRDVRIKLLELIDSFGRASIMPDTSLLIGDLLDNYGWEIEGMSRRWMATSIKGVLESMAKAGKIERSPVSRTKVEWISHQYVPKARW